MNPQTDHLSDIINQENFGYTLASPWLRLGAVIIEGIVIYVPLYLFLGNNKMLFGDNLYDIVPILTQTVISALLGAVFYSLWSGNLGHKILGMKVVSAIDGADQKNPVNGIVREALKSILSNFFIPAIWLLWDSKKQNLYDKVTKTLVVKISR